MILFIDAKLLLTHFLQTNWHPLAPDYRAWKYQHENFRFLNDDSNLPRQNSQIWSEGLKVWVGYEWGNNSCLTNSRLRHLLIKLVWKNFGSVKLLRWHILLLCSHLIFFVFLLLFLISATVEAAKLLIIYSLHPSVSCPTVSYSIVSYYTV